MDYVNSMWNSAPASLKVGMIVGILQCLIAFLAKNRSTTVILGALSIVITAVIIALSWFFPIGFYETANFLIFTLVFLVALIPFSIVAIVICIFKPIIIEMKSK
jgi:hypothetical protein